MSLTSQEILEDLQKLINRKCSKHEHVEPELYNAVGLIQDLLEQKHTDDTEHKIKYVNNPDALYGNYKTLIDCTAFQSKILNLISNADGKNIIDDYLNQTCVSDRKSFIAGMVYASLSTNDIDTYIIKI